MLNRLLRMNLQEVSDRSLQEASKWIDRRAAERAVPPAADRGVNDVTSDDGRDALDRMKSALPLRFFAGTTDSEGAACIAEHSPEARTQLLAAAEGLLLGRFDLLGYRDLDFGNPVDWHLDAVSGRKAPLIHWSRIDPTNAAQVGDCKVIWELNRQQFLTTLGAAYQLSGDERYARRFADLAGSWLRANPPGLGINWASSLEAAFRIVSWSWAIALFRDSDVLTPSLFGALRRSVEAHASHIERYLSTHSSPNTHLTGEALGLFYAGALFPDLPRAAQWLERGRDILERQIPIQVSEDGIHFEQSTAYQAYTIEICLHFMILASHHGVPVSDVFRARTERMLDVLLALRRPDGSMPAIGDGDGGTLFAPFRRNPDDARGLFAIAASWFGRADCAWAAGGLQPEAVWMTGSAARSRFRSITAAPPRIGTRAFSSGAVVMRSGFAPDSHHLIFDASPLGCPFSGGHGHADLLSVEVSPFGEPCIVDPGTFIYSADPGFRDYFRSTRAHGTILVDGRGQAEPNGPFRWLDRPEARLRAFTSTADADFANGSHSAYASLRDPVHHRRRVLFLKDPGCWVIVDDLAGAEEHRIDLRFQFAPLRLRLTSSGWMRAVGSRGTGLLMRTFSRVPLTLRIAEGSLAPIEGWVSRHYGHREKAPLLSCSATARLPLTLMTVLVPARIPTEAPPMVTAICGADGTPVGLRFAREGRTLRVDDESFRIEEGASWKA